jgi:hypothetical protein
MEQQETFILCWTFQNLIHNFYPENSMTLIYLLKFSSGMVLESLQVFGDSLFVFNWMNEEAQFQNIGLMVPTYQLK